MLRLRRSQKSADPLPCFLQTPPHPCFSIGPWRCYYSIRNGLRADGRLPLRIPPNHHNPAPNEIIFAHRALLKLSHFFLARPFQPHSKEQRESLRRNPAPIFWLIAHLPQIPKILQTVNRVNGHLFAQ